MSEPSPCPDYPALEHFVAGRVSPAEAERLAHHLEACSRCADAVEQLLADDSLTEAIRAQADAVDPVERTLIEDFVLRLQQTPPTIDWQPPNGVEVPAEDSDREWAALLAPAQAPGEMGRLGTYRVLKLLGAGGMGFVFQAHDPHLDRLVALKVMKPVLAANPSARQRFLREAKAAAALKSDHVVTIHQVGEDRGVPYLAMEFLEGEPLDARLRRDNALAVAEVVRIGREAATGLAAAHQRGLIHRDVKPANLWLEGTEGRVKVLDFGLARGANDAHVTQSGAIVGTPAFMSPEQARGEKVDARCDLFSLGCVLYQLAIGRPPFRGNDALSTLMAVSMDEPPSPKTVRPELPAALSALIVRLLTKDREGRPGSAREVVDELRTIERSLAEPLPAVPRLRRSRRWLTAAAVLLALGGVALLAVVHTTGTPEQTTEAYLAEQDPAIQHDKSPVHVKVPPGPDKEVIAPLVPHSLVRQPVSLPGLKTWTIETIAQRGQSDGNGWFQLSPDGQLLATGCRDGAVRLWNVESGHLMGLLFGHQSSVMPSMPPRLAWNRGGTELAGLDNLGKVRIWDVPSGRLRLTLPNNYPSALGLAWSPDGSQIAVSLKKIEIWEVRTGQQIGEITTEGLPFWSPDGQYLAVVRNGQPVQLWNPLTSKLVRELAPGPNPHYGFSCVPAWTPDSKRLVVAYHADPGRKPVPLSVWETESGQQIATLEGPWDGLYRSMTWSSDGKLLAVGHGDTLSLVDPADPKARRDLLRGIPEIRSIHWSPDGQQVTVVDKNGTLRRIRTLNGFQLWKRDLNRSSILAVAWSPDRRKLATVNQDRLVRLWDSQNARVRHSFAFPPNYGTRICWSPDGSRVLIWVNAFGFAGQVKVVEADSGKVLQEWKTSPKQAFCGQVSFSPDSSRILASFGAGNVNVYEAVSGKELLTLDGQLRDAVWLDQGRSIGAFSIDGKTVEVREGLTGKLVRSAGLPLRAESFAWLPDGKAVFVELSTAGGFNPVVFKDFQQAQHVELVKLPQSTWYTSSRLALSPDATELVAVTDRQTITKWAVSLRQIAASWNYSGPTIASFSWSRDSRILLEVREDDTLRFRDVTTGQPIGGILVPLADDKYLLVSPDGHYHGSPGIEQEIVYIVLTDDGTQETLTPKEFEKKYSWKNDPAKARLLP